MLRYSLGHEAQYVVISAVRTEAPGFLRSRNRTNVMLTRCKRGMVLVSKRDFLVGPGRATLLGELAQRWSRGAWRPEDVWIHALELSDGRACLPGMPGHAAAIASAPSPSPSALTRRIVTFTPAMSPGRNLNVPAGSVIRSRASSWATVAMANLTPEAISATRSVERIRPLRSAGGQRVAPNGTPGLWPSVGIPTRAIRPGPPYSSGASPAADPPLILPSVWGWPGRNSALPASGPAKLSSRAETPSVRAEQPKMPKPKLDSEGEFPLLAPIRGCRPWQAQQQAALKGRWRRGSEACRL